ncbi:MAG TPA: hypothetical protein VG860_04135 [Terriglobia bacterium]|jgi:hypothetical protein|nr:hypothetical protein [Terriglobia bacterium]
MSEGLLSGLQYGGYGLELVLLIVLLHRGYLRPLRSLCIFVGALLAIDAGVRPLIIRFYGETSSAYYNLYWVTDLILVLASFALICAFFRRACLQHRGVWKTIRPALTIVLVLELGISTATFLQGYHKHLLFTRFIYGFSQNLYFTCVVLNTVLYLMLQWFKDRDQLLHLLVCGLGIQYAGPAAAAALSCLTRSKAVGELFGYLSPVCGVLMLGIWVYAVMRQPRTAVRPVPA